MEDDVYENALKALRDLQDYFPDDVVVIGGLAAKIYADREGIPADVTHDADAYISRRALSELRETEDVAKNSRLSKYEWESHGIDVDLYVERDHKLAVPFEDMIAGANKIDGRLVAAPEHLLVLKIDAGISREGTPKGEKDQRDCLALILVAAKDPKPELLAPYMSKERFDFISRAFKGKQISVMTGNPHDASKLRSHIDASMLKILTAIDEFNRSHETKSQHNPPSHDREREL